jgi:hypothetical protein
MLKLFVQVHEMDYEMVDDHHPIKFVCLNKIEKKNTEIPRI